MTLCRSCKGWRLYCSKECRYRARKEMCDESKGTRTYDPVEGVERCLSAVARSRASWKMAGSSALGRVAKTRKQRRDC